MGEHATGGTMSTDDRAVTASWAAAVRRLLDLARELPPLREAIQTARQIVGLWARAAHAPLTRVLATVVPPETPAMDPAVLDAHAERVLAHLSRTARRAVERVFGTPFLPLDEVLARIARIGRRMQTRIALTIRTETAHARLEGTIRRWGLDPQRDWYWYSWNPRHDDRTKDVSLLFEASNTYSYTDLAHLYRVRHQTPQRVRNRHTGRVEYQTSKWNCRCAISRTPKPPAVLYREGKISRSQYAEA